MKGLNVEISVTLHRQICPTQPENYSTAKMITKEKHYCTWTAQREIRQKPFHFTVSAQ